MNLGAASDPSDVLLVNVGEAFVVDRTAPPAGPATTPFVMHVWTQAPSEPKVTPQPHNLGDMRFPTPLAGSLPQPKKIWNNIGKYGDLGYPNYPSNPAPSTVLNKPASITNAVTLRVQ